MSITLMVARVRHCRLEVTHEVPRDPQGPLQEGRPAYRFDARLPIVSSGAAVDARFLLGSKQFGRVAARAEPGFAKMARPCRLLAQCISVSGSPRFIGGL